MELLKVKAEIDEVKTKLYKLMDSGADFPEIYETSIKLDRLINIFQRHLNSNDIQ